jgi:iron complex outermembrane receptor protein
VKNAFAGRRILSSIVLGVVLAPPVLAQPVERVEITGSALRRIDAETALPVQIITREEVERTGATNVEQFLQGLNVALQGNSNSVQATASGASTGGVSGVSLRGLGSQRTLVLIDGKRVAAGGTLTDSTTVDVNHIPVSAIERVEVLKEGASAIYGSDAIAGVINFILRKDYRGGEVTVHGTVTEKSPGNGWGANTLIGFGDFAKQNFNATIAFDFRKQQAIYGKDRDFASRGIFPEHLHDTSSGNTFPANFAAADGSFGTRNPSFATGCLEPYSHRSSLFENFLGSQGCRFDPSKLVSLIPETEQASMFLTGRLGLLNKALEAYGQFSYSQKDQRTIIQPVPISDQFALPPNHPLFNTPPYSTFGGVSTFLLQPSSPFYPTAFLTSQGLPTDRDLLIRYRDALSGNRDVTDESEQIRGVVGLKGSFGQSWDYDAALLHVETKLSEKVNGGYPSLTGILPVLNSGLVNPFGPTTDPTVLAQIEAAQFRGEAYRTKNSIDSALYTLRGDVLKLPAGSVSLAIGGEGRKEAFKLDASPAIQQGDISGYGGNFFNVDRERGVKAFFVEAGAPLHRTFEVTAAARYDDYEGTGSKTSPKVAARWQPTRQIIVRGSWSEGFRAPSLTELYQPQTTGVSIPGLNDPARCPTTGSVNDCGTQFPVTLGGNPSLEPETSTNVTLGMVFQPTSNMSFGLDWWQVKLKETIIFGIAPDVILADPQFAGLITRAAPDATCPGCPGRITDIVQTNLNFGETHVKGIDADFNVRFPTARGVFTLGLNGTYFLQYEIQNLDGSFENINGKVSPVTQGNGGVIPKWRHYAFLDWSLKPWNVTFANQYQTGYEDVFGTFEDPDILGFQPVKRRVGPYSIYHLFASYEGLFNKNLRATAGIRNLFDKDPPYTNQQNYFQSGYDPGYVDPRGRLLQLSLTYKFM